ncbi:hypothetical protein CLTEP_06430 [Clostridium tepidiprofundi DSM 19306]|uniref:Uncharacterized protein n=1 Tax=Clostridium tepidiprofundi DSM 19306 TaxID=1121338 RepID=A0A151B742_9CLOT|nr:hypothetical protein [Clostridium tepidiprofundi]KYH35467.1 hypothetical protein CLTEP_06430 [Clostridium tepidiprofundi DSM 19306]
MNKKLLIAFIAILTISIGIYKYNKHCIYMGNKYFKEANFGQANTYYNKIFIKRMLSAIDCLNIGETKQHLNKYKESLIYFEIGEKRLKQDTIDTSDIEDIDLNLFLNDTDLKLYLCERTYYGEIYSYNYVKEYEKEIISYENYLSLANKYILNQGKIPDYYYICLQVASDYGNTAYILLGRYDDAIEKINWLLKHIEHFQDGYEITLKSDLVTCYVDKNNYNKALEINNELIKKYPNNVDLSFQKAYIYANWKDVDYALEYLYSVYKLFPENERLQKIVKSFDLDKKK